MVAKGFRAGQRFKFPDNDQIYIFRSFYFDVHGEPFILYEDINGNEFEAAGFELSDLIHV